MPKYSPKQSETASNLATIGESIIAATKDSELVSHIRETLRYARIWVRCNTEAGGRGEMRANAVRLQDRAARLPESPVTFACIAFALATREFGYCNYREAQTAIVKASRVLSLPRV